MDAFGRILTLGAISAAVALFHIGSDEVSSYSLSVGLNLLWSAAPLCAGFCCMLAATVSGSVERRAWTFFGAGCFLWLAGMLTWTGYQIAGADPSSPGAPDIGYLSGALCFIPGMFLLVARGATEKKIELWNFVLLASGGALAIFALCLPQIASSRLGMAGTALALAYPAIWAGTAGTGLVSLILYAQPRRSVELFLIVTGLAVLAAADLLYGLSIMAENYKLGSYLDGFWVIAFALFAGAGVERRLRGPSNSVPQAAFERHPAEAFFAATIVAVVSVAVAVEGALLGKQVSLLSIPVALLYAFAIGAREYLSLATERTLRQSAEASVKQLAQSERRLSSVLESTTDSVVVLDRNWNITYRNRRARETVGDDRALEVGRNLWSLFPEEVGSRFDKMYRKAMTEQQPASLEEYLPAAGRWLEIHAFPTPDSLTLFFRDVSTRRQAQEKIMKLAYHDTLTELGNRELFQRSLEQCLLVRPAAGVALLCMDLDHFKEVNDSFGHNVGDLLLKQVANRLVEVSGADAIVARLGGDEFAILVPGQVDTGFLFELAHRIIAVLGRHYEIDNVNITVGSSIGIAVFPMHAAGPDELFCNADTALYFAKSGGRGRALLFQPEMTEQVRWKQALRADLADATQRRQFHLVFQPIVDLASNQVCDFEALIRWHHPHRGEVSPSTFVPIAEESGLINEIGDWVLETACAEAAGWPTKVGVTVNLSACQFRDQSLPARIEEILQRAGLPAPRLTLEVTESLLLESQQEATRMLTALRNIGVRIALDDFGTGYSSLSYLRTFPLDKIKIDRSFVNDLESTTSSAIIRAVVDIAETLGSAVIAEGVETRQQLDGIRKEGCGQAQGYFFSGPVNGEDVVAISQQIEKAAIWWTDQVRRA